MHKCEWIWKQKTHPCVWDRERNCFYDSMLYSRILCGLSIILHSKQVLQSIFFLSVDQNGSKKCKYVMINFRNWIFFSSPNENSGEYILCTWCLWENMFVVFLFHIQVCEKSVEMWKRKRKTNRKTTIYVDTIKFKKEKKIS